MYISLSLYIYLCIYKHIYIYLTWFKKLTMCQKVLLSTRTFFRFPDVISPEVRQVNIFYNHAYTKLMSDAYKQSFLLILRNAEAVPPPGRDGRWECHPWCNAASGKPEQGLLRDRCAERSSPYREYPASAS